MLSHQVGGTVMAFEASKSLLSLRAENSPKIAVNSIYKIPTNRGPFLLMHDFQHNLGSRR